MWRAVEISENGGGLEGGSAQVEGIGGGVEGGAKGPGLAVLSQSSTASHPLGSDQKTFAPFWRCMQRPASPNTMAAAGEPCRGGALGGDRIRTGPLPPHQEPPASLPPTAHSPGQPSSSPQA